MKSKVDPAFWKDFNNLPVKAQRIIEKDYRLWQSSPFHSSLHFKRVHATLPIYSARCGINYRVVGIRDDDLMIWFFVGSHADYDALLKQL